MHVTHCVYARDTLCDSYAYARDTLCDSGAYARDTLHDTLYGTQACARHVTHYMTHSHARDILRIRT